MWVNFLNQFPQTIIAKNYEKQTQKNRYENLNLEAPLIVCKLCVFGNSRNFTTFRNQLCTSNIVSIKF